MELLWCKDKDLANLFDPNCPEEMDHCAGNLHRIDIDDRQMDLTGLRLGQAGLYAVGKHPDEDGWFEARLDPGGAGSAGPDDQPVRFRLVR